jgi:enoyl-CoA hydratase
LTDTTETDVSAETRDGVCVITLNAPQRRNALTPAMCDAITTAMQAAERDPAVSALVFAAAGEAFCAGADLAVLRDAMPDPVADAAYENVGRIYDLFRAVVTAKLPTIAAVQGAAVGAGLNLVLACDVRIVADDVRLSGFGRAGLHPGGGHMELLRGVDRQLAAWMTLFNQPVGAQDAVRTGLAWMSVPPDKLLPVALDVARGATRDAQLTRRITTTFRAITDAGAHHDRAVHIERGNQVWSLRRKAPGV